MSILSDKEIRRLSQKSRMIEPFFERQVRSQDTGELIVSFGLSSYGYDLRVADEFKVFTTFIIRSWIQRLSTPDPLSMSTARHATCLQIPSHWHAAWNTSASRA